MSSFAHPKVKKHLKQYGNIKSVIFPPSLLNLPNNVLRQIVARANNKSLTQFMRTSRSASKLGKESRKNRKKYIQSRKPPGMIFGKEAQKLHARLHNLMLLEQVGKITRASVHRRRR